MDMQHDFDVFIKPWEPCPLTGRQRDCIRQEEEQDMSKASYVALEAATADA